MGAGLVLGSLTAIESRHARMVACALLLSYASLPTSSRLEIIFSVLDINSDTDFPAITKCLFQSHEHSPHKFFNLVPVHVNYIHDREEAIKEAAKRLKLWHSAHQTGHWLNMVDRETGKAADPSV